MIGEAIAHGVFISECTCGKEVECNPYECHRTKPREKYKLVWIHLLPDFKTITGHAIYKDGELIKTYIY